MMHIIAGKYKNRTLVAPSDKNVRPIMSRVKEWIFSVLQKNIANTKVCDLFAGSGSFGFEAASHDAREISFVEHSHKATKIIEKNAGHIKIVEPYHIYKQDVLSFLSRTTEQYDIIFADPPYEFLEIPRLIQTITQKGLLKRNGFFIIEHHTTLQLDPKINTLLLQRDKKFGKTIISIYRGKT